MKIQKVWAISFSATGNTERTVKLLAEELALRDLNGEPLTRENYTHLMERIDVYLAEFNQNGTDNISIDIDE